MFRNTPEKFIRASNLLFLVTLLKIVNIIILDFIPKGETSLKMYGIIALFVVTGFVLRRGYKWFIYCMPLIMLFPFILLQTNIVHVFNINPLAAIIIGFQFFLQIVIMEILLSSSKVADDNRGLYSRTIRL
jgi:hypothetical protein